MFKKYAIGFALLALLVALLPGTSFAGKNPEVTIHVRNNTGGPVSVRWTHEDGSTIFNAFESGQSEFDVKAGVITYYAITPCGTQVGKVNVSVSSTILLSCRNEIPSFLSKTVFEKTFCDNIGYYEDVYDPSRQDGFVSWTNQEELINRIVGGLVGELVSSPQDAVDILNDHYAGQAHYWVGCYDGISYINVLTY